MARKSGGSRNRASAPPSVVPTAYPGKTSDGKGMEEPQWTACRDMLDAVYKAKDGSRRMCDIFRELPDRDEWADYYEAIPEPECLDNVAAKLGENGYGTPEEMFKQLHLVFLNAKHYNEEESQLWADAQTYDERINEAWKAVAEKGIFAWSDPYHKSSKVRRPRAGKQKSVEPKTETGTAPGTPATEAPPPVIKLHVSRPDASASPAASTSASAEPLLPAKRERTRQPAPASASPVRVSRSQAKAEAEKFAPPKPPNAVHLSASDESAVAATDAKLPRWGGPVQELPGDPAPGGVLGSGWWGEGAADYERSVGGQANWKKRIATVANAIATYKDHNDAVLSETLSAIPAQAEIPFPTTQSPVLFPDVLANAKAGKYATLREFDADMVSVFDTARRWYRFMTAQLSHVLTLQRLYNAVTAPYPLAVPPSGTLAPHKTRFASLPAGPGTAKTSQEVQEAERAGVPPEKAGFGVTSTRISSKDRIFTEEARHKGVAYRTGDYIHLINPDDPSRPIVGQIFRTFVPTKGYITHHVTVCWYFRPEQTVHPADKMFVENEVFKTGYFCDHPVQDILEHICIQPLQAATRGRPKAPSFYPGRQVYVCGSRYINHPQLFLPVKKWANIVPEKLRTVDATAVTLYQHPITLPQVRSPFTLGVKGPGGIGAPRRNALPMDDEEIEVQSLMTQSQPSRRPSDTQARGAASPMPPQRVSTPQAGPSRTPSAQQVPQARPQQQWQRPPAVAPAFPNRTFAAIMGGQQVLDQVAVKEYLPNDTTRLFEQDARHQVLWFSGPPLPPGAVRVPVPPNHSMEYLVYLSKRKQGHGSDAARPGKRFKTDLPPGAAQANGTGILDGDLSKLWWAQGQSEDEVLEGLKAVAEGRT